MKLVKLIVLVVLATQIGYAQEVLNRAKAALAAKDTAAALSGFQEAARLGQRSGEANYFLGAIALKQGRVDDAIGFLSTAVKIDDENVDALLALGEAHLAKGDNQSAITQFKRAAKVAPKNCNVMIAYGSALVEAGLLDGQEGAIVILTRAKDCAPDNPNVYVALGDAYRKQGVAPLANMNYEKALDLSPKDVETQMKVARTYASNRQYNEAVQAFIRATSIDSTYFDAYFEAGKILFRAKLFGQAARFMYHANRINPKHPEAASIYTQSLVQSRRWSDAVKAGETAVKLDPENNDTWRAYASALVQTGDYDKALKTYEELEKRHALKPEDYSDLSTALFRAGKEDKALEMGLKAVEADSTNCDPYFNLGFIYMKKQEYANAARMFEKKIECDPKSLSAYLNAGSCYMQPPKNLPRARELFLKAVELRPDFLQARTWLARYYLEVDSTDLMRQTYDEVIRLGNEDPAKNKAALGEAYSQLGSYHFGRKNYAAALADFRRALSYNETSGLNLVVGQCMILTRGDDPDENRKRTEEAIGFFRRAIAQDPNNAQAHFWLANSLTFMRREGDTEGNRKLVAEACASYARAFRLDPRNDDAKKAMERIGCK